MLVSTLVTVILLFATVAPEGSITVPRIDPSVACPHNRARLVSSNRAEMRNNRICRWRRCIVSLPRKCDLLDCAGEMGRTQTALQPSCSPVQSAGLDLHRETFRGGNL